ncbi:DUF397 domain-containing protein [Streptomyces similanensis]|uniref:DUF397 domain-containing protein n=1 Tax=Streptomyces similanensis TaxID=1274988 RepID=A0ABP9LL71_9ACTN
MTNPAAGNDSALEWFKSSYSTTDGPECVEVAHTPQTIHVRDSKAAQGPHLAFPPEGWAAFLSYASA